MRKGQEKTLNDHDTHLVAQQILQGVGGSKKPWRMVSSSMVPWQWQSSPWTTAWSDKDSSPSYSKNVWV